MVGVILFILQVSAFLIFIIKEVYLMIYASKSWNYFAFLLSTFPSKITSNLPKVLPKFKFMDLSFTGLPSLTHRSWHSCSFILRLPHSRSLTANLHYPNINLKLTTSKVGGSLQNLQTIFKVMKLFHACKNMCRLVLNWNSHASQLIEVGDPAVITIWFLLQCLSPIFTN